VTSEIGEEIEETGGDDARKIANRRREIENQKTL